MRTLLVALVLLWPVLGIAVDRAALKTEVTTDPTGLGYGGDRTVIFVEINANRAAIQTPREVVQTWEIIEATVPSEWAALSAAEKQRYGMFVSAGEVDLRGSNIRSAFAAMFVGGTTTRANLIALQTEDSSRAMQLFGEPVTYSDIDKALK